MKKKIMKTLYSGNHQLPMSVCKKWLMLFFLTALCNISVVAQSNFMEVINNSKTKNFNEIVKNVEAYFDKAGRGRGAHTGYKQFRRWVVFNETNLDANGNIVDFSAQYLRAVDKAQRNELSADRSMASFPSSWQSINGSMPFYMGRVSCLTPDPANNTILYAGTPAGGLWRSVNAGGDWTPITDGIPSLGVSGVVIDRNSPANNRTIYILTGDGDGKNTRTVGILVSRNNGSTWQNTDATVTGQWNEFGFRLIGDPTNPLTMYAATTAGIYKTTDGWATRTLVYNIACWDLEMKPGDPNTLYAVNTFGDFLKTTSAGTSGTWNTITTGLPARTNQRWAIAVSPANSNMVFFLNGAKNTSAGTYSGLYISTTSGSSFTLKSSTPNILGYDKDGLDGHTQSSWYDLAISVSPTNTNVISVGGIYPWSSKDGGATWTLVLGTAPNLTHGDIHVLEYIGSQLYCGSDGGITASTNNGTNWTDLSAGLFLQQPYGISVEPYPSSVTTARYIMGCQDIGTQLHSGTVNSYIGGGDGYVCEFATNNYYYTANASSVPGAFALFKKPIVTNVETKAFDEVNSFDVDDMNYSRIFVGNKNMYRSTDDGITWVKVSNNTGPADEVYYTVDVASSNANCVYASRTVGGNFRVFRTTNATATAASVTWADITGSGTAVLPNKRITDLEVHSGDHNTAWVCYGDWLTMNKIYRTTNGGTAWTDITGTGLPTTPIYSLAYKNTAPRGLFAGTAIGVYVLEDGTTNWVPFKTGLPNTIAWDLDLKGNWLFVGTFGRGVWGTNLEYCPDIMNLAGTFNGNKVFEADQLISSVATIGSSSNVTYKAMKIKLLPGFETNSPTNFKTLIAACGEAFAAAPLTGIYTGPDIKTGVSENELVITSNLTVSPNPFNATINVSFSLTENANTKLIIQNVFGQEVFTLEESMYEKGDYQKQMDMSDLPSGIYFLILKAGTRLETKKIIKIK
jgi:hypothetical protein